MPEEAKEESDEEDEEDEECGRIRFKSERKDSAVVRLGDVSKRRDIPETLGTNYSCLASFLLRSETTKVNSHIFSDVESLLLYATVGSVHYNGLFKTVNVQVLCFLFHLSLELSEKAKQDLMEFEEQERQKKQYRYGGRGRGGGGGRGGRGRGGFPAFGMVDFRGNRGRMHDQRLPLMGNMGMQVSHCTVIHLNNFKGIIYLAPLRNASLILNHSSWSVAKGSMFGLHWIRWLEMAWLFTFLCSSQLPQGWASLYLTCVLSAAALYTI